ncbi:MAG: hypothetical protein LBF60_07165 [Treponema sp.]|nr:hypothetical protein [Treponema sp.]
MLYGAAAANESFVPPFAALAVVPPSLAFPALVLVMAGFSFNAGLVASFIAVSGIAVNAAGFYPKIVTKALQNL